VCEGYRDEASLIFRSENVWAARAARTGLTPTIRRRASIGSAENMQFSPLSQSSSFDTPSSNNTVYTPSNPSTFGVSSSVSTGSVGSQVGLTPEDPSDLFAADAYGVRLFSPYPWVKNVPASSIPSVEDQAVDRFLENYVLYPVSQTSSPGFLEHLPNLFKGDQMNPEGRLALRWAVRAVSYASVSSEQHNVNLASKSLECYGLALSALGKSLGEPGKIPDDYELMTIVILDMFEVSLIALMYLSFSCIEYITVFAPWRFRIKGIAC
jgi:hypothetical protein